jgi:hypothetical protein
MRRRGADFVEIVLGALTLIGLPLAAAAIILPAARGRSNKRKARLRSVQWSSMACARRN